MDASPGSCPLPSAPRRSGPRSRSSACSAGSSPGSARDRGSARRRWPSTPRRDWATGSRARSSWRSRSRRRPVRRVDGVRCGARRPAPLDDAAETDRFVRRQRRDALAAVRLAPRSLFRPRFSRRPPGVAVVALLLLAPVLLIPNPQDAVIAQQQQVREAAERQAEAIDRVAQELEDKGADANDPRTRLAQELRDLAQQLRQRPNDLDVNLARLGAIETEVRSQIDPANEQRAASLTVAEPRPVERRDRQARREQGRRPREGARRPQGPRRQARRDDARRSSRTSPGSWPRWRPRPRRPTAPPGTALSQAAQSLAQGDTAGAKSALDRLGEALTGADQRVTATRDLSGAASRLQDARRDLADAGRQTAGQGQQGQGQQGQAQGSPRPSGQGQGQGQGQGSPNPSGQGQGKVRARVKVKARGRVKARVRVRGKGQGQGQGQGQGPGARSGSGPRAGSGRHRWRRLQRPLARQRHRRQRPPGRPDQPEPAAAARAGPVVRLRAVRPPRQARRPVVRLRHGRRRPDPAGQRHRPGLEQRGADALPAGLHRLRTLRADLARPRLHPALDQGLRPRLLLLARPIELTARRHP